MSSPETLDELAQAVRELDEQRRSAIERRNAAIRAARRDGARPVDLNRATQLHPQVVLRIISAAQPEPEPGDVAELSEAARTATARHEDALTRRNAEIRAAVDSGAKITDVIKSTGLSRSAVHVIRTSATTH